MPKIITSPVDKWPGTVTLHDPLTFPQNFAWKDSLKASKRYYQQFEGEEAKPESEIDVSEWYYTFLPGLLACVEAWDLSGGFPEHPTLDTFPATPTEAICGLFDWLIAGVTTVYSGEEEIPKES